MKIGICNLSGFSNRWIEYCKRKEISYKILNPYKNSIINDLKDCDIILWHFSHGKYKDVLFAKQLLYSAIYMGKKVFPDFNTSWHFDDKIGQKYLLEAIDAPFIPTYIFYTKQEAMQWINITTFPKVFKLRGGAGSSNVFLISNRQKARKMVCKAFGKGFSQFNRIGYFKERIRLVEEKKDSITGIFKGLGRLFIPTEYASMHGREKGYVYFQDFIPDNRYDIRTIFTDNKVFAIKRMVRANDFRASGSGNILYDRKEFDERCIKITFEIQNKLNTQSLALDFVFDANNNPLITELSYGYNYSIYDPCPGYWDVNLNWHEEKFIPQEWILEQMLKTAEK